MQCQEISRLEMLSFSAEYKTLRGLLIHGNGAFEIGGFKILRDEI